MKHVIVSIIFGLLLVGCSPSKTEVACSLDYWDGTYGTCLPDQWVIVSPETLRQRGVPVETLVAFQSEVASSGQFPTVAVTREPLSNQVDPSVYSDASVRSVTSLPNYSQLDSKEVKIDDQTVTLHVFTSQPIESEPARRFYQISTVSDDVGYTITSTTPVSVSDEVEAQVKLILMQSTFIEAVEEEK
jgi:hypothetical protein